MHRNTVKIFELISGFSFGISDFAKTKRDNKIIGIKNNFESMPDVIWSRFADSKNPNKVITKSNTKMIATCAPRPNSTYYMYIMLFIVIIFYEVRRWWII